MDPIVTDLKILRRRRTVLVVGLIFLLVVVPIVAIEQSEAGRARRAFTQEMFKIHALGIPIDRYGTRHFLSEPRGRRLNAEFSGYDELANLVQEAEDAAPVFMMESIYVSGRANSQLCFDQAAAVAGRDWPAALKCLKTALLIAQGARRPADDVWWLLLELLSSTKLSAEDLEATREWLEGHPPRHTLAISVQHAVTVDFWWVDDAAAKDRERWTSSLFQSRREWPPARVFDQKRLCLEGVRHTLRGSHTDAYAALAFLVQRGEFVPTRQLDTQLYRQCLAETRYRMAYTAVWLKLQRLETGTWPSALPDEPQFVDGFADAPLKFSTDASGLVIRSKGLIATEPVVCRIGLANALTGN